MLVPAFCGGAYQARSPVIAADTAINVYVETREVPGSAKQVTLYGTPGLTLRTTSATASTRGWFTEDGLTLVVIGGSVYSMTVATNVLTEIGTLADDGLPVSFASNGRGGDQVGVVGGGELGVWDTDASTWTIVSLPFANPVTMAFMDGYALINERDTPRFWFSALEDMTSWDALDFITRSGTSDNIVAIAVTRDRLWTFGSQTTTQFYDAGDPDVPFLPYPGTTTQIGLAGPYALAVDEDVAYWIGSSSSGQPRAWRAVDAQPQAISTPAIEGILGACDPISSAEILIYEQSGHLFVVWALLGSPDDVNTYAYDVRESLWHARASWDANTGTYQRWRVRGTVTVDNTVLAGDALDGRIYTLDLTAYDEDGDILPRERTTPYLSAENQWLFLDTVELGIQAGVGLNTGQGSDPEVFLDISRDGARTWVSAGVAALGAMGAYGARAIWRRLGRSRADRLVLRVRQTDPVACVWGPGLWVRATNGTGNL